MLRKRVVSVLTFNQGVLFRSKLFTPDYRYTTNFVDSWSIDEIIILDITRPEHRDIAVFESVVNKFARQCFVPMCVGGGITKVDDCKAYLDMGADKVAINTALVRSPELITEASEKFGSQCVIASIDVKKVDGEYRAWIDCGREITAWTPESLAKRAEKLGAGEILLTSIDRDGSLEGFDNKLNCIVSGAVNIPLIVCGGAGKWQDFADGFLLGGADAVATTNVYHFTETSIKSAKQFLTNNKIPVRI